MQAAAALALAGILSASSATARAQSAPSDYLQITADSAQTWNEGSTQIVQVEGPVTIQTDTAKFTAKSAVIWLSRVEGSVLNRQRAEIALIGDGKIEQGAISRSGERLFAVAIVGGPVRLTVETRKVADPRPSALYKSAGDMRPLMVGTGQQPETMLIQRPWIEPASTATPQPTTVPTVTPKSPVSFTAQDVQTTVNTPDGNIAAVLKGGVLLIQRRPNGDMIELQAQQAVLFTTVKDFKELQGTGVNKLQDAVTSAYLEGDVRVNFTPAPVTKKAGQSEQRLSAERVYYEFATDRAVLTDVVLQSTDPRSPLPVTMRANTVKQLALGEYKADDVVLTTSQFATPSYSVNASKAYVRQYNQNDQYGTRTAFKADHGTFRAMGLPFFWLPRISGEVTERGLPLRNIGFGSGRSMGTGIQTQWGLFETLGAIPPQGLDASFNVDYYTERGLAGGFDASYQGGFITEATRQPWTFQGDLTSYLVQDGGEDRLGRDRLRIQQDDELRGRILWQHQHFLPDNWQVQLRAGYISDPTFLEEWFEKEFNDGLPSNLSAYVKKQENSEALTFLVEYQPSGYVTTADALQERYPSDTGFMNDRPFEIDRLPEVGYYRIGESAGSDRFTFFSENRLGGYAMSESDATLSEYGFRISPANDRFATPGIPSYGYTGASEDYVVRGDFRQQIDYPIDAGEYKIVPYIMGRYTGYSDSPEGDVQNRLMAGVGTRITTAFWSVDDAAQNTLLDIHRIRHVIEPELHLFASVSSVARDDLYIYDETIDGINDIAAASFYIRQRWQTKRGGPGKWRSSDFLALNVGVIAFANEPDDPQDPDRAQAEAQNETWSNQLGPLNAKGFRGLFFQSTPEASIPRTTLAADALWRISDSTILLSDVSWNISEQSLATVALGLLVGRGERITYHTGLRYIGELDSTIASFNSTYQLTAKYSMNLGVAIDLSRSNAQTGTVTVIRRFDRFFVGVGAYYDATEDEGGFEFSIYPEGVAAGIGTNQLSQLAR